MLKKSDLAYKQENEGTSHVYRLILKPDNTARVEIDGEKIYEGSLKEDWELLAPKDRLVAGFEELNVESYSKFKTGMTLTPWPLCLQTIEIWRGRIFFLWSRFWIYTRVSRIYTYDHMYIEYISVYLVR